MKTRTYQPHLIKAASKCSRMHRPMCIKESTRPSSVICLCDCSYHRHCSGAAAGRVGLLHHDLPKYQTGENDTPLYVLGSVGVGSRGCLAHACDANSCHGATQSFALIASKVSPIGGPRELKTHAHWEQPQPRKRDCSIHTSSRGIAAIYGSRSLPQNPDRTTSRLCRFGSVSSNAVQSPASLARERGNKHDRG